MRTLIHFEVNTWTEIHVDMAYEAMSNSSANENNITSNVQQTNTTDWPGSYNQSTEPFQQNDQFNCMEDVVKRTEVDNLASNRNHIGTENGTTANTIKCATLVCPDVSVITTDNSRLRYLIVCLQLFQCHTSSWGIFILIITNLLSVGAIVLLLAYLLRYKIKIGSMKRRNRWGSSRTTAFSGDGSSLPMTPMDPNKLRVLQHLYEQAVRDGLIRFEGNTNF